MDAFMRPAMRDDYAGQAVLEFARVQVDLLPARSFSGAHGTDFPPPAGPFPTASPTDADRSAT